MNTDSQAPLPSDRRALAGWLKALIALAVLAALVGSCMAPQWLDERKARQRHETAMALWQERCQKSGEFIHKTVEGVEGIYLINVRTHAANTNLGEQPEDQFRLSDPYGHDSTGDTYILNFIQGFYHQRPRETAPLDWEPPRIGYRYVEAVDPKDGQLYRFTGRVEEPWQLDPTKHLKGYTRFVLDRQPIEKRSARYGVKFEDISTREEREYWIAGSSLKVIDLETNELIAERVGYMVDWAQGSRAGARQPWTLAANNACPAFVKGEMNHPVRHASAAQDGQALDFVEKSLKALAGNNRK